MAEYDDTNSGTLWKNDRKENDRQPDYKGSINVDGVEYWLSAWIKTAGEGSKRAGQKFMSLSVTAKEPKPETAPRPALPGNIQELSDDIPF